MGELTKIVTEHYPVENLPKELQHGLERGQRVRVTIEAENTKKPSRSLRSFLGSAPGVYSEDEAVSYIRKLRDE